MLMMMTRVFTRLYTNLNIMNLFWEYALAVAGGGSGAQSAVRTESSKKQQQQEYYTMKMMMFVLNVWSRDTVTDVVVSSERRKFI